MPTDQSNSEAQAPLDCLTCQQVTDAIIDYLTGDMEPETVRLFTDHLQRCPDCVAFLNTYNSTVRATRSLSYDDVPDEMRARVRQFILKTIADKGVS
jgi:predicted anti-sigma-YlaC factor YlaD